MLTGLITATLRRRFEVRLEDGTVHAALVKGRDLEVACGDQVELSLSAQGEAIIENLATRQNVFFRADAFKQKTVAANVDQVVAVLAPHPRHDDALLTRWLVAAEAMQVKVLIVANKTDLPDAANWRESLAPYERAGYRILGMSSRDAAQTKPMLMPEVQNKTSVLIGQSGVGKSTLLNCMVGNDSQRTGDLSAVRDAGTHTTTHTRLFSLDAQTHLIDSPGMQVFGLAHLSPDEVETAFPEFRSALGHCRFRDCSHGAEPDCALKLHADTSSDREWTLLRLAQLRTLVSEIRALKTY